MKTPNFFIIGAPKTGTTAMAAYLAAHPQVFMSDPKEPHHFNSDNALDEFADPARYATLFEDADESHRAVGEASVWYMYSKVAVPRIEAELPGSRYIAMLRNPVEMAVSLHEQQVFTGYEPLTAFEDAWNAQERRRAGRDIPRLVRDPERLLYKEACSLGTQLGRVFKSVPRERVLCTFTQDLRCDPRKVWCQVQEFLGLDDDGREAFPLVNSAKARKIRALTGISRTYLAIRQTFGLPPAGTGILDALNRWNWVERKRAPLSPDTEAMLRETFAAEVTLLEHLTGRDLSAWR